MGLIQRLMGHDEVPVEAPCPRCGVPAPEKDVECTACGWDLREAYHDPVSGVDTEAVR